MATSELVINQRDSGFLFRLLLDCCGLIGACVVLLLDVVGCGLLLGAEVVAGGLRFDCCLFWLRPSNWPRMLSSSSVRSGMAFTRLSVYYSVVTKVTIDSRKCNPI